MTYGFTERWPIVAKWGTERWDVWEGDERIVGTLWDWRAGWAGDQLWAAEASTRFGGRLASSRGVVMTTRAEAVEWLRSWWILRRSGLAVEVAPAPGGVALRPSNGRVVCQSEQARWRRPS